MASLPLAHISWAIADNADRPACDAFFIDLFGAETAFEMLVTPETAHYRFDREERLMVIGNTMLIPIAPAGPGAEAGSPIGDMLRRTAGHNRWIGLSFRAQNLRDADAWFRARGFDLHYDRGMENNYFLIARRQFLGIRIEVMQGELPGDPRLKAGWNPDRWRDDHPLGIEGLLSIDLACDSLADARALFEQRMEWPLVSERELPGEARQAAAFDMGDAVVEAISPAPDGASGLCGMTFKVTDAAAVWQHLQARGFSLIGSPQTRFAIAPDEAHGRLIWFTDQVPAGWPQPRSLMREPARFPALPDDATAPAD
ncbi:MAG: VOC family protein [Novosphingobium sp.]